MRWPWQSAPAPEARASSASYADEVTRLLVEQASGEGRPDSDFLGIVAACAGMWARSLAAATVTPDSLALAAVTPQILHEVGLALAMRGESLFAITVAGGAVRLDGASAWDVQGDGPNPEAWRYRLDLPGPSGHSTVTLSASAVLHVRMADSRTPWRGRSPLHRASETLTLAGRTERALSNEMKMTPARVLALTGAAEQLKDMGQTIKRGGLALVGAQAPMPGVADGGRLTSARIGPEPPDVLRTMRTEAGQDIANAFGISPALFAATGDGSGQREAWRRFWAGTMAPLASLLEAEIRAKLDSDAMVELAAMRASDEDGRSRAVARRATAFKTFVDAGLDRGEAMRMAGLT